MSRKSEADFVNEGFSAEELSAIEAAGSGDTGPAMDDPAQSNEPATADPSPTPAQPPQTEEPKMVDIRALQEARAEARRYQEELAAGRESQARLEERLNMINEAMQRQQQEPKGPTRDEDPLAYFDSTINGMAEKLKAMEEAEAQRIEQVRQAQQQEHEAQSLISHAGRLHDAAKADHPDLDDALQFAIKGAAGKLQQQIEMGMVRPEHFDAALKSHVLELIRQSPNDPAGYANHIRAHARFWGFTGPQAPQQQQPSVADLAARQERHMSLSGTAGGEPPKALDAKSLADMSDKEFQALMKTVNGRKQVSALMGE